VEPVVLAPLLTVLTTEPFWLAMKNWHAVVQLVVQRDLGDGGLDGDLALRPVDLADGLLDDALRFLVGVDQHGVVGDIGGNPDILQNAAAGRPGTGPEHATGRNVRSTCGGSAARIERRSVGGSDTRGGGRHRAQLGHRVACG
jgi:hypothetical protein